MAIKSLFTFNFGEEKFKKLSDLGYEIILNEDKNIMYSEELKDVELMFTFNAFETLDLSKLENLKWIQLQSDGVNHAPLEYIKENNIILTNNKDGYSIPIAEWIVCNTLSLYKKSYEFYKKQEKKLWKPDMSLMEIYGQTIGIIGTGTIAQEAAKRFKAFGVTIYGLNTNGRDVEYFDRCYTNDSAKEMLPKCDVIISLLPITDKTYRFINEDLFKVMKDGVIFVNASRGDVVDQEKLIEYIRNGKIKGAALDVVENEPLASEDLLWSLENVIITPHNSWVSQNIYNRRFELAYENMKRYKENNKLLNVVNLERGY